MINDYQTNIVYLADGIRHYMPLAINLFNALDSAGVETHLLRHTESSKHVWARDYMPVQVGAEDFVKYVYRPDYLKENPEYIPRYGAMVKQLGLPCRETRLVIDGGNVVKGESAVIMTDKVLRENALFKEDAVKAQLEKLFECRVCLIPWDRYEMFGHADGMVRFIDRRTVLLNNYVDFDPDLRKRLLEALKWQGFAVEELHYDMPRPSRYSWAYLNCLQVAGRIFVPGLGIAEDRLAVEQIQQFYPDHKVVLVPECLELVRDGGALNCVTWNVLEIPGQAGNDERVPTA